MGLIYVALGALLLLGFSILFTEVVVHLAFIITLEPLNSPMSQESTFISAEKNPPVIAITTIICCKINSSRLSCD